MLKRDFIVFVNTVPGNVLPAIKTLSKDDRTRYRVLLVRDSKFRTKKGKEALNADREVVCDFNSPIKITKAFLPYQQRILAISCRGDASIPDFTKLIPHLPYIRTPTVGSLSWSVDKIMMRRCFRAYDKSITPRFMVAADGTKKTLTAIKKKINFPLILKPAGLGASLLVSVCFHKEELEKVLRKSLRYIRRVYKENGRKTEPSILVEEFMEGEMYSVDGYVSARGTVYFCPMVHVKTGRSVGFDDFFSYQAITPTLLKKTTIKKAEIVAEKAVHALGLRSTTVHVELMRTDKGWKVIELGPRIGGFRHWMYLYSYGIDHAKNDIMIRIPRKPLIPRRVKGYSSVLKFFAKKEGTLRNLSGIKRIRKLSSCVEAKVNKKIGDKCRYAKHGGRSVCDVYLFNKKRPDLLADIRRLEKMINIRTA
jgi:biotin carboxylase